MTGTTRLPLRLCLAVNVASSAFRQSIVLRTPPPEVIPTPEQLFGIPTYEEAERMQHYLLRAPIRGVKREMMSSSYRG